MMKLDITPINISSLKGIIMMMMCFFFFVPSLFGSAFISLPITRRIDCNMLLFSKSHDGPIDQTSVYIIQTLQDMRHDLLSNPSKLRAFDSIHGINKSDEVLVQEALLNTRLSFDLNRTRIADSTLPDAGRGLFATDRIPKGELITCYPGDALLCEYERDIAYDDGEEDCEEEEDYDDELEVILWGDHIDENDRIDDDEVFDGKGDGNPPLISYAASVDDEVYSVIGMPSLDQDPAYYGHFANDGGGHIALRGDHHGLGIEEMLSLYVEKSVEVANAKHVPLGGGLHLGTVAMKDIEKDEEIFVSYGPEYWVGLS